MNQSVPAMRLSPAAKRLLLGLMALGLLIFLAGLLKAPERIWPNFLIAEYYLVGLGLGAAFFIAVQYVSYAGWGTAIRRIPEAMTSTIPIAGLGIFVLIFGIHSLYEWSHPSAVASDEILRGKSAWLNEPFFVARLAGYFILWTALTRMIVKNSLRQDGDNNIIYTKRNVRNSVMFIITGVFTFSLASVDLLMSLQPHWYSTVFGFLNLTGMFMSGLAIVAVFLVIMRHLGYARFFTTDHLHDVGRLMMSFSVFWVYMWVSQHMLIWYSNIPEETSYYIFRHFGGWGSLSFLNVILNWLIPFVVLLPRASKRNDKIMLYVAIVVLIGHWLDLYIMVMPSAFGAEPTLGIWEIGPLAGVLALFFWVTFHKLFREKLIPINDPYLAESLPHL